MGWFSNKFPFSRKQVFLSTLMSIFVGLIVYFLKPNQIKLQFPYTTKLLRENQFSCESLVGSVMRGGNNASIKGIEAEVAKGTDKLIIEIEGNKLYFLTKAAFEAGYGAKTDEKDAWRIIQNNKDRIIAIFNGLQQLSQDVNLLIINKSNGIGIWTKTESNYFLTDNPATQAYYLLCK